MMLYIVFGGHDCEGEDVLGVFDTEEQAEALKARVRLEYEPGSDKWYFDSTRVCPVLLNNIGERMEEYLK